jgi:hypothetical protein
MILECDDLSQPRVDMNELYTTLKESRGYASCAINEFDNKAILLLHEMLQVESYCRIEILGRGNPCDLYALLVPILSHHLVQP